MNTELFYFINHTLRLPLLDAVMPALSDKNYVVLPGAVAAGIAFYAGGRRARTAVLALMLALVFSDFVNERIIKPAFERERPYAVLEGVHVYRGGQWLEYDPAWAAYDGRRGLGFPSSHAANTAAVAAVLGMFYRRTLWVLAPLSFLVGFSRIYTGSHFPLDVVGGWLYGAFAGVVVAVGASRAAERWLGPSVQSALKPLASERRWFYWLLGGWAALNLVYLHLSGFGLAGDEAQYWDWSRRLDWSYYSKPPLVAYVNAMLASAAGSSEWALRSGALLSVGGALTCVYALALRITGAERTALYAAIIAMALPFTWAGAVLMTVDPLLVLFWTLAMYTFHKAVHGGRGMWAATGLALGLGLLAKYTMALLFASFALYLVLIDRNWLRRPGPYLALGIAMLLQSGVVYWNWANGWVSFRHTAAIGARPAASLADRLGYVAEFVGGQAAIASPILFALFAWAMFHCLRAFNREHNAAYLALCALPLFLFYTAVALSRPAMANWPVCAYPAAAIALPWVWSQKPRRPAARKWLVAGLILGCAIGLAPRASGLLYAASERFQPRDAREDRIHLGPFELDPGLDPTNRLVGGADLGEAIARHYHPANRSGVFLFSDRYMTTALTAFYAPGRPEVYCINLGTRRMNQYDIWYGWDALEGLDALFVVGGDADRARFLVELMTLALFESGEILEEVEVRRGKTVVNTYTICRLYRYSGLDWRPSGAGY